MDQSDRRATTPRAALAVGIDVAEAKKGIDLVALNPAREVIRSHGRLKPDEAVQMVRELRPAVVCIDSPPAWATRSRSRDAERELALAGIHTFATPTDPGDRLFYRWMRVGMLLFDELADLFPRYRGGSVDGTAAEVFPHAIALLLAGRHRHADESKGRFRRAVLHAAGVRSDQLPTLDRVDAALAALTGVIAVAGGHAWVGDPEEGVILLPAALPATRFVSPARSTLRQAAAHAVDLQLSWFTSPEQRHCDCGCGAVVRARFLPGHDAKLKSRLLREVATGQEAAATLRRLGWWKDR